MTKLKLTAAGALAVGLVLAGTAALAQPYGKAGDYVAAATPAPAAAAATHDPDCCPDA